MGEEKSLPWRILSGPGRLFSIPSAIFPAAAQVFILYVKEYVRDRIFPLPLQPFPGADARRIPMRVRPIRLSLLLLIIPLYLLVHAQAHSRTAARLELGEGDEVYACGRILIPLGRK